MAPLLQLALDFVELEPALEVARRVRDEVDIVEVGTPLVKAEGMRGVKALRDACPDNLLLADMKTPDVGALEAQMAFDAGADWMTVIWAAPRVTIAEAVREAQGRPGHEVLVEMTGLEDIERQAARWRELGVERIVYHKGWDEGNVDGRRWTAADLAAVQSLTDAGFKVSVAGALDLDSIDTFVNIPVSVFVVGRAIHGADDPVEAARRFKETIRQYWA